MELNNKYIAGAGGSKDASGAARTPEEQPNSLRSHAYAKALMALCEGQIKGPVDGLRSIYFDDVPVQNTDGTYNFTNLTLEGRSGTQNQNVIPGFNRTTSIIPVNQELTTAAPTVQTVTDLDATHVMLNISTPALYQIDKNNGDMVGTSVAYKIEAKRTSQSQWLTVLAKSSATLGADSNYYKKNGINIYKDSALTSKKTTTGSTVVSQSICDSIYLGIDVYFNSAGSMLQSAKVFKLQVQYRKSGNIDWINYDTFTLDCNNSSTKFDLTQVNGVWLYTSYFTGDGIDYIAARDNIKFFFVPPTADYYEVRVIPGIDNTGVGIFDFAFVYQQLPVAQVQGQILAGKTNSKYEKQLVFPVPSGAGPWDIRITRLTPDSTTSDIQNKLFWDSVSVVKELKLNYPNTAMLGMSIDAKTQSNAPNVSVELEGMIIKVPTNYDPATRSYTRMSQNDEWDGTFKLAYSNNPVWCLYDLIVTKRYGTGHQINATNLGKWNLYQLAKYCDENVNLTASELSLQEPRYTCNMLMVGQQDAKRVIDDMCSIFRGMNYWMNDTIGIVADKPSDPVALFGTANVKDGIFTYSGSGAKARHTVAVVSWNNPKDSYKQHLEYVEDQAGIIRYGYKETRVIAVGCTSQSQAHRVGKWLLYTESTETDALNFTAGLEAAVLRPGDIIKVADKHRAGKHIHGRIKSVTEQANNISRIQLDRNLTHAAGAQYQMTICTDNRTTEKKPVSFNGSENTCDGIFNFKPVAGTGWVLEEQNLSAQLFRVLSVKHAGGIEFEVTALAHNPNKYNLIEQDIKISQPKITILPSPLVIAPPKNLNIVESGYEITPGISARQITISWTAPTEVTQLKGYEIKYREKEDNWITLPDISADIITVIKPTSTGIYDVEIRSVTVTDKKSIPLAGSFSVTGDMTIPATITGFTVKKNDLSATLSWDAHPALTVQVGGSIIIRHTPNVNNAIWEDGIDLITIPGNSTNASVALMSGTYMIRAKNSYNIQSLPAYCITTVPNLNGYNAIININEHPVFAGTKSNMTVTDGILSTDNSVLTANYETAEIDLSSLSAGNIVKLSITGVESATTVQNWDEIDGFIDEWAGLIDSENIPPISISTMIALSTDGIIYSDYIPFVQNGSYDFWKAKLKVIIDNPTAVGKYSISAMTISVDAVDRTLTGSATIPAAGSAIVFTPAFLSAPAVQTTIMSAQVGDYVDITNKTNAGMTVFVRDSAGVAVQRDIDWFAKGAGYAA